MESKMSAILFILLARSTSFGRKYVNFPGSLICNNLPALVKSRKTVSEFKNNIKRTGNTHCEYMDLNYFVVANKK